MGAECYRRLRPEPFSQNGSRDFGAVKTTGDRHDPRWRRILGYVLLFVGVVVAAYPAVKYGSEWLAEVLA